MVSSFWEGQWIWLKFSMQEVCDKMY